MRRLLEVALGLALTITIGIAVFIICLFLGMYAVERTEPGSPLNDLALVLTPITMAIAVPIAVFAAHRGWAWANREED